MMTSLLATRYFDEFYADISSADGENGDGRSLVARVGDGAGIKKECPTDTTQETPVRVAEDEDIRSGEAAPVAREEFFVEGIPRLC